jgi:hypothetical protein
MSSLSGLSETAIWLKHFLSVDGSHDTLPRPCEYDKLQQDDRGSSVSRIYIAGIVTTHWIMQLA